MMDLERFRFSERNAVHRVCLDDQGAVSAGLSRYGIFKLELVEYDMRADVEIVSSVTRGVKYDILIDLI